MTQRTTRLSEIATASLLTAFFVLAAGSVLGLAMSDDSSYMQNTLFLYPSTFGKFREWGPLYTLWFKLLEVPCRNPISRYFLSWGLIVTCLGLIPTWLKTRSAWLYTLIVLALPVFTIWPFVSLFAAAILLFSTCILLRKARTLSAGAATACLVSFILSFVRPEFGYGAFAATLVTAAAVLLERKTTATAPLQSGRTPGWRGSAALVSGCACLSAITRFLQVRFPNPVPRSGMAFAQHFTLRAAKTGQIVANSSNWQSDYAERCFGIDPGHNSTNGSASIADFYHANPHLFFGHLWHNLIDPLMLGGGLVLVCVLLWPWLRTDARQFRGASLFLALMSIPTFAAMLLIYPRGHYATTMFPAVTILFLRLLRPPVWQPRYAPWVLGLGCCAIWLSNVGAVLRSNRPASPDLTTLSRVQCAHTVDLTVPPENHPVFAADSLYQIYLPHRRLVFTPDAISTWSDLKRWAAQVRPAWISTDPELPAQYGVTPHELDRFLQQDLGYTSHPCPVEAQLTIYTNDAP